MKAKMRKPMRLLLRGFFDLSLKEYKVEIIIGEMIIRCWIVFVEDYLGQELLHPVLKIPKRKDLST